MSQSHWHSLLEAHANVAVGFGINYLANLYLLPLWGFEVRASQALGMGVVFTGVSLVRSYVLRRVFNGGWR